LNPRASTPGLPVRPRDTPASEDRPERRPPELEQPLPAGDVGATLLEGGTGEELGALAEIAPGLPTPTDALPLAEAARLKLTDAVDVFGGVDEGEMAAPHSEGAGALFVRTLHGTDPKLGATSVRRPPATPVATL